MELRSTVHIFRYKTKSYRQTSILTQQSFSSSDQSSPLLHVETISSRRSMPNYASINYYAKKKREALFAENFFLLPHKGGCMYTLCRIEIKAQSRLLLHEIKHFFFVIHTHKRSHKTIIYMNIIYRCYLILFIYYYVFSRTQKIIIICSFSSAHTNQTLEIGGNS